LVGQPPLRLGQRHRLRLGIPTLGEVPETLSPSPADDGDVSAPVEDVEHHADVTASVPAARLPGSDRMVGELAVEQRASSLELAEDKPAKTGIRLEELAGTSFPRVLAALSTHPGPDERQILDRPDEGAPLEELRSSQSSRSSSATS